MSMIRNWVVLVFIGISIFTSIVDAQAPSHRRQLFRSFFWEEEENEYAIIKNIKGRFSDLGWESMVSGTNGSRLLITMKNRMPQAATLEWTLKNYDPANQTNSPRQHLFFMTSTEDEDERYYGDGSWVFLRTGTSYVNDDGSASMKIDIGSKGVDTRVERFVFEGKQWDKDETYWFKLIYDNYYMWIYFNDELLIKMDFPGQVKRFNQISFAGDPDYPSIAGPIFSDFSISTYENEMYFIDKTVTKNAVGLGPPGYGAHGIAVGDVNGDGLEDFYLGNCIQNECLRDVLYIQQPDGTFSDETAERGVLDECCSHAVIFFDADNDGDLDLFNANTWEPNQLYINDGAGYFTEESFSRGIENIKGETRGAVVFDVNNDGWLDIFAVNWGMQNEMYINDGTGNFIREYRGAEGAVEDPEKIGTQGVTVADIDNDGDYDIYIAKRDTENELYLNEDGYFRNVAAERGVAVPNRSDGATFADFDNDGDMDLFVSNTRIPNTLYKINLYIFINDGNGFFQDKTDDYDLPMEGFTPLLFDANNDGNLDLYRLRNNDYDRASVAMLSMGDGEGNFQSAEYCGATIVGADARTAVSHDFDGDGDLDLYVNTKLFENVYLENRSDMGGNNWIEISTIGPDGDLGGIGSKIDIYKTGQLGVPSGLRGHREVVTNQGYLSSPSYIQHFGLGDHTSCDVRVTLTDGTVIERENVAANQRIVIAAEQVVKVLEYVSGDNQSGVIDQLLAEPFRVRVVHEDGTPVENQNVSFVLTQGDGSFEGNSIVQTDANGYASIYFRLGPTVGQSIVEARVSGAQNSPLRFTATAREAAVLVNKVSGDAQSGIVGALLSQQIVARTVYEGGGNAAGIAVTFEASNGGLVNGLTSITVQSDAQGQAAVSWTLGASAGVQTVVARVDGESTTFSATALPDAPNALQKFSGDGQALNPGVAFTEPFRVKLVDKYGNGISGQSVLFQVTAGAGTINGATQLNVSTDNAGIAGVVWTPDPYLGPTNRLQASASLNGQPLVGSPVIWTYNGVAVDAAASTVAATSPVPADGTSTSEITVTLKNSQGQSVGAGLTVALDISGSGNLLNMPSNKTDANGQVRAWLSSTFGENKTVTARVLGLNLELAQHPTIEFQATHGEAVRILIQSGDGGTATVTQSLPLVVKVVDASDRPVPNHNVTFIRLSGDGAFAGSPVFAAPTVGDGTATAMYTFGETAYVQSVIEARAESIDETVRFTVSSRPGEPRKLAILAGNNQQGPPRSTAPEPLMVSVKDLYDNNIAGYPVQYKVNIGDCLVNGASQTTAITDSSGRAVAAVTFGERTGQSIIEAKAGVTSVTFTLHTTEEMPDPDLTLSQVTATSPVPADGYSTSHIVATIFDSYGRPIPGAKVRIVVAGEGIKLVQPDSLANANGQVTAELSSTVAGNKVVMAYILPQNSMIEQVATVTFEAISVEMDLVSGQNQVGVVGKACPAPLVVRLQHGGSPVVDQYVKFSVDSGDGHFSGQDQLLVQTDEQGLASAQYFLATKAGVNIVKAEALISPEASAEFYLRGRAGPATRIVKAAGDNQTGGTQSPLSEPLAAMTSDMYGNPASGDVTFVAVDGGLVITPQPVFSDTLGRAEAVVKLGDRTGRYTFKAELSNGEFVLFTATAQRNNHPPEIISYVPYEATIKYAYGDRLHFEIMNVFDRDGDPLNYSWVLNGRLVGVDKALTLYMSQAFPTVNAMDCFVSDGMDSTSVQWTLLWDPTTQVELASFSAEYLKGKGVQLQWRTKEQQDNAGFRVLRSLSEKGSFAALTTSLIAAQDSQSAEYRFLDDSAQQPGVYFYKLESISKSGSTQQFGPISISVQAPEKLALYQNYPNPFNPTTSIIYELPAAARVNLAIYNQQGQRVRQLVDGEMPMGMHSIVWDAVDDQGRHVPSGIYFYTLAADGQIITRKLTLMK